MVSATAPEIVGNVFVPPGRTSYTIPTTARVNDALFLFVAHDLNPRAMSRRVQGFMQARSWFQDLTTVDLQ